MIERRRFRTGKYDSERRGYPVFDRSFPIAFFIDQGMAIQFCRMLRAYPQIANSCDACQSWAEQAREEIERCIT